MKKYIVIAIVCMLFALAGCGNRSLGLGNYSFKHIHFTDAVDGHCATVEKWYENESGIEVDTKEYGAIWCSEGTYIMFESGDECPYC